MAKRSFGWQCIDCGNKIDEDLKHYSPNVKDATAATAAHREPTGRTALP